MARTIGIGLQNFEKVIQRNVFYIDKTSFIKEWWENQDEVTLITRPRRFGKTLAMSMVEQFFSIEYKGRTDLFEGLYISRFEEYQKLQGTFPVISLSFAEIKETTYDATKKKICQLIAMLYDKYRFLLEGEFLSDREKAFFQNVSADMEDYAASLSIKTLCGYLSRYYGKNVIILLDEYDTPMQEAFSHGYWNALASFSRSMFNSTFKTNPYLERAILTGITRVSKESIFSDLNNLEVITTTSTKYESAFGFTEDEVFRALEEYGVSDKKSDVKNWYDGFTFGNVRDIYNPWSILNFLDKCKLSIYWANTSSNSLIGMLIREGSPAIKLMMQDLMEGKSICTQLDEQIVYNELDESESALWSLLLASGYLKILNYYIVDGEDSVESEAQEGDQYYELSLTNLEVRIMFRKMIRGWFQQPSTRYNEFIKALLTNDLKAMNVYMNQVALMTFSYFDSGKRPSKQAEPERLPTGKATTKSLKRPNSSVCFFHGFVLGLIVDLSGRYMITSNRESGFGRYDVMLEPIKPEDDAIIMEFKVRDPEEETTLEETVQKAHLQMQRMEYAKGLIGKGIAPEHIRMYGFAFEGKHVLIG